MRVPFLLFDEPWLIWIRSSIGCNWFDWSVIHKEAGKITIIIRASFVERRPLSLSRPFGLVNDQILLMTTPIFCWRQLYWLKMGYESPLSDHLAPARSWYSWDGSFVWSGQSRVTFALPFSKEAVYDSSKGILTYFPLRISAFLMASDLFCRIFPLRLLRNGIAIVGKTKPVSPL